MNASGNVDQVKLSLKLVVHKETNKVLTLAEAGKDFVDILISFLTLPLGTIARLAAKECDLGPIKIASLSSLYESVGKLGDEYMMTDTCKEMLLQPRNPMEDYCRSLKINVDDTEPTKYYVCNNLLGCGRKTPVTCSTFKNKKCSCGKLLDQQISPSTSISFDGFVKIFSSFLVTDDLCLLPMTLNTTLSFIKKKTIEDMSSMKEIIVDVTKNKLIDLLKCSLVSKTQLTDVFLHKEINLQKFDGKIVFPNDLHDEPCTRVKVIMMYRKSDSNLLCAQGNEDFANFLLSILTFPIGAVVHLLQGNSAIGSFDGLYKSIVDLSEGHFITKEVKAKLVDLGLAPQFKLSNQVLPISEFKATEYDCVTNTGFSSRRASLELTDFYLHPKNECLQVVPTYVTRETLEMFDPISRNGSAKGFVGGPTVYVATDDLFVSPMSSISAVSFLRNVISSTLSDIEEKEVSIGLKEGLSILKALLTSSMALTNVKREGLKYLTSYQI